MSSSPGNELNALLSLLDDSDRVVYEQVSERLITLGKDVIPRLEDCWSNSLDPMIQERIEDIIHKIQFDALKTTLRDWSRYRSDDLLSGLIHIARFQYPDLDEPKIHALIDKLKESAVVETQMHHSPVEKTYALNRLLYEIFGFRGNTSNFHSPQNSFINIALETRKGNPLMLGCIYSILARHAGMPVYGINLPEHFVLAYCHRRRVPIYEYTYPRAHVLFYINGFNRGNILYKNDIDKFLGKLNIRPESRFFEPCSNIDIIRRSMRNLAYAFRKLGDEQKMNELDELIEGISGS